MLTVADVMTRRPILCTPEDAVARAVHVMREHGITSVLVAPAAGTMTYGILTMRDVIGQIVTFGLDPDAVKVGEITSWRLIAGRPSWSVREAAQQMAQARIRRLPVMDDEKLAGLVSDTDLFTSLVPRHEWEHARAVRKERALRRATQSSPARTVRDLMSTPVLTVAPGAAVLEAVEKMVNAGVASLLIPDDGDPAAGIVTKRDVVTKVLAQGLDANEVSVGEIASMPVVTIEADVTIEKCSARMSAEGVRRFPVREGRDVIGIISDTDILAAVAGRRWWGHRSRRWPTSHIVADVMRSVPPDLKVDVTAGVTPELTIWECAAVLARTPAPMVPVVQEGRPIGVVSRADILRALEERGGGD